MAETPAAPQEREHATATANDDTSDDRHEAQGDGAVLSDESGVGTAQTAIEATPSGSHDPDVDADPHYRSSEQTQLVERLHEAVKKGDVTAVQALLERGALQALLERGALVREDDQDGKSAIHLATHHCHAKVVELLKAYGVSIDEHDTAGKTQLVCEAESGGVKEVQFLLTNGASIDATDLELKTALFAAAENGHLEVARLLVENHATVDAVDQQSRTPLFDAAKQGHVEIVKFLVDRGASVDAEQKLGRTPLMLAVSNGHLDVASFLLEHSSAAAILHKDKNGWTSLHVAVGNGRTELVSLLVAKNASIDERGPGGVTPLYLAAQHGHAKVVELLIKAGAAVDAKQDQGRTSLLAAVENGSVQIAKLLIDAGASVHEHDEDGISPLHAAASKGHAAIAQLLVAGGASMNVRDSQEKTALMAAAKFGHFEIVKFLVAKRANVDDTETFGRTALMLAISNRHQQVVDFLLDSGASLEVKDHAGWSPLHVAAGIKEKTVILSMLIQRGARIDEQTLTGETPLDLAIKKGCGAVISELLKSGARSVYKNPDYPTLLISAGRSGHISILPYFMSRGGSLHSRDPEDGETILLSTARWGYRGYFKFLAIQSTLESAKLSDGKVSLLAGTLATMKELCEGTEESKTMYTKVVERLADICLQLQAREAVDDRDKIFADIVYRVCRQLLRCRGRPAVARFIANDANIRNLRDLHEEIDSFMKKLNISGEAATHSNWLESWATDKKKQTKQLCDTVKHITMLEDELADGQAKVDAVIHLQFLLKNLGKVESTDKSTTEDVIRHLGGGGDSKWHIPVWFISRYNIDIEDWNAVGKSRFVKGRWVKSDVMISKCNLELAQFEEIAATWQKLGHPNVLDLFGACHASQPRFFVCDTAKDQTLKGHLRNNRDLITKLTKLHEAALGMLYLQKREIVLGNLTTEKILVGEDGKTKIGGFELGVASVIKSWNNNNSRSGINWTSPEVQRGGHPSYASDVYALGVCILDILTLDDPWRVRFGSSLRHYLLRSATSPPPGIVNVAHWRLVKEMCAPNPSHRVVIGHVVRSLEYFKSAAEANKSYKSPAATQHPTSGSADEPDKPDIIPELGKSITNMLQDLKQKCEYSPDMRHMAEHIHLRLANVHAYISTRKQSSADMATVDLIKIVKGFDHYLKVTTQEASYARLLQSQKVTFGCGYFHTMIDQLLKDLKVQDDHQLMEWKNLYDQHAVKLSIMHRGGVGNPAMTKSHVETVDSVRSSKREVHGSQEVAIALRGESQDSPNQDWFIDLSEIVYDQGDYITEGGFGAIFHGVWLRGTHVVVKFILNIEDTAGKTTDKKAKEVAEERAEELFLHEVNVWHRLQHPHVVRLWGACNTGKRYFVCEYASKGTLSNYLKRDFKGLTPDKLRRMKWKLLHQAAMGLQYVHGKIIIHNDLKCNNILIGDDGKAKLTDFGLSSMPNGKQLKFNPKKIGATPWKAPEYLTSGEPSFESDIYSFAMCILEAITGDIPWGRNMSEAAIRYQVLKKKAIPARPPVMSDNEWSLIELMTRNDPAQRVGISYVVGRLQEFTEKETTSVSATTTTL